MKLVHNACYQGIAGEGLQQRASGQTTYNTQMYLLFNLKSTSKIEEYQQKNSYRQRLGQYRAGMPYIALHGLNTYGETRDCVAYP